MEAVQIASGPLELLDPFFGLFPSQKYKQSALLRERYSSAFHTDLCDHHVAVKGALAVRLRRLIDVPADLSDHRRSESNVRDEVSIPEETISH